MKNEKIREGGLTFCFSTSCHAAKYDDWAFYRNQFQSIANGCKAVDILCVEGNSSWLIEIKNYRSYPRTKVITITEEIAIKVRDTLGGLAAAAKYANDQNERELAKLALEKLKWRVVLHLELPVSPHRLWPQPVNPVTLLRHLKRKNG